MAADDTADTSTLAKKIRGSSKRTSLWKRFRKSLTPTQIINNQYPRPTAVPSVGFVVHMRSHGSAG